ncbi:MAG: hypothetical protein WA793_15410 [Sphingorhabdus sp.]|uniref:hypothetical protein n=1 Tax=Sphingorhabdus sp. TaxID=1902408 RepID=UPI003C80611F
MSYADNHTAIDAEGFYLAAFGVDGVLEGEGYWNHNDLSKRWLMLCEELIAEKGVNFDHQWTGPLSKIRTKMTSANGACICTFFVVDRTVSSVLLLRGIEPRSELEVSMMFVESLRASPLVAAASDSSEPFADAALIVKRPLMIVVPFPDPVVSDESYDLVRELSLHLASAFMRAEI